MSDNNEYVKCRVCKSVCFIGAAIIVGILSVSSVAVVGWAMAALLFLILLLASIWIITAFCGKVTGANPLEEAEVAAPVEETPVVEPTEAGKPELLSEAREGGADDLKKIKGVGPKLEGELNANGVYHFDQIASWSAGEVEWADEHLVSFKGRVSRDNWVEQAKTLTEGGDTAFSKKVDKGGVY